MNYFYIFINFSYFELSISVKYRVHSVENAEVYITSKEKNRRNFGGLISYNVVFNPFSSRFGLPLHNTHFPGLLMKSIRALFYDRISFLASPACVLHLYYKLLIKTTNFRSW